MAFSELELKRIEKLVGGLCWRRTHPELADQLRFDYAIKGHGPHPLRGAPRLAGSR
ncbi:MAG TPA: hypothetical protein VFH61_06050 [Thermoleophilia bacterium]|nr:hypothetical protein [Thermoleophilia bacterium]